MLQNPCKTLGFKKNMAYKIPLGEVNHIQPVAYLRRHCNQSGPEDESYNGLGIYLTALSQTVCGKVAKFKL